MNAVMEPIPRKPTTVSETSDEGEVANAKRTKSAAGISKTVVNFWVDLTLLLVLAALSAVAVVVQFVFPRAAAAEAWTIWGYSYHAWSRFQFGLTGVFLLGVLLHVMLHWTWVCGVVVSKIWRRKGPVVQPDDGIRTLYGVATLVVFLATVGAVVAAAAFAMHGPG